MLSIRPATIEDVPTLSATIRELAEFERELNLVITTEADLARDGFGPDPKFRALIADWDDQPAGYALFFDFYSTWRGRQLYLEDLFVRPQSRNRGIGKRLLAATARIAAKHNCHGMRWEVLDWNHPAIEFYKSLGADFLNEWRLVLLKNDALQRLAEIT
jgi:GNAT superfamily N-acetyltransferase